VAVAVGIGEAVGAVGEAVGIAVGVAVAIAIAEAEAVGVVDASDPAPSWSSPSPITIITATSRTVTAADPAVSQMTICRNRWPSHHRGVDAMEPSDSGASGGGES
jgi:hypothetical protein